MEEFSNVILHLVLSIILYLELLFVELAQAVDASADVVVVEEGARVVIMCELNQKDGVTLVGLGRVHSVFLRGAIGCRGAIVRGTTCVHHSNCA